MKKLYLIARNHMDPSWLRCFQDHFTLPTGETVRPYADIEETQILEYMDFAEKYGVKYQIEQSLVVKEFLKRNPDQLARFKALVKKGLIELAGGGEAVIDVNLTSGESWARNHLYSRTYYKKTFNHAPRYAITPDIFGLASQLPQFFRSVGYDALIIFDRVLKHNKPFWRGLDGTLIVLDGCFLQPPEPNLRTADCVKLPACGACGGKGCALCGGTGLDSAYDMTRPDKELRQSAYYGNMSADVFLEKLLETDKENYFVMITTEEPRIGDFLYGPLKDAAKRHGIQVCYLSFEENHDTWCSGQREALLSGDYTEDQIDTRREGNPAACGCYTSRIEIKKANAELEQLLFEAECLACAVRLEGGFRADTVPRRDYPAEKLEALWNKMAFIQFHDCITGTHCDASYHELLRYVMEVRRGAYQIYADAAAEWSKLHPVDIPEGYYAAVCFNPTDTPACFPQLNLRLPDGAQSVLLYTASLTPLAAFDLESSPAMVGSGLRLHTDAAIPPFGRRVFLWKPCDQPEQINAQIIDNACRIENEFFRIDADASQITGIYDKKNGRTAIGAGAACLAVGTDIGSLYGRSEPERDHRRLFADRAVKEETAYFSRLVFSGTVTDPEKGIEKLIWTQTVTLYKNESLIRIRTDLDWQGRDTRVFACFPPAFACDEKLYCEVPFGMMERGDPGETNLMGITDEWPTLGYAGISDGSYNVAVLKGGFPGTRIRNGALQLSLFRAVSSDNPNFSGTNDCGKHTSDYAIAAWSGSFASGNCAALASAFKKQCCTFELTGPGKWQDPDLLPSGDPAPETDALFRIFDVLPPQLRLSALKWAEDGTGPVVRLWESTGAPASLSVRNGVKLRHCNTLEEPTGAPDVAGYTFRPFEIATFRIILLF